MSSETQRITGSGAWGVGFRYIYLLERFIAHQSCVYTGRVFCLLPLYPTYVYTSIFIIELTL